MSTRSPVQPQTVARFRPKTVTQAEASDRILLGSSLDWLDHFAEYADKDTAHGIYRRIANVCAKMERERGFGRK